MDATDGHNVIRIVTRDDDDDHDNNDDDDDRSKLPSSPQRDLYNLNSPTAPMVLSAGSPSHGIGDADFDISELESSEGEVLDPGQIPEIRVDGIMKNLS